MTQILRPTDAAGVHVDLTAVPAAEEAEVRDLERYIADRDNGVLAEEDFRRIRLNNGIYGIRHQENVHMVRVKFPGGVVRAGQLRILAKVGAEYARGFGHITTRQNIQFHLVAIDNVPTVMRWIASAGMTTREACGDTVRNVQADPLAGVWPGQPFDVTPWADAAFRHFLRNPAAQRLPRKFKINFSGDFNDWGQAAINCIGPIAVTHPETGELGFRVLVGGGLGTTPFEAQALEDFTPQAWLIPTLEAILRVFDREGERKNRNRSRLKWLIQKIGIDEFRTKVLAERNAVIAVSGVNPGLPDVVVAAGADRGPVTVAPAAKPAVDDPRLARWLESNVVATTDGAFAAFVTVVLGDITTAQFLGLADIVEDFAAPGARDADVRFTNRQNLVFRGVPAARVAELWDRLDAIGLGGSHAHAAGDPVSCPGADTCNLAITQSRGLAKAVRDVLLREDLGEVPVKVNISGCSNSCGQHHLGEIGLFGTERRFHGVSAPGYQLMVGGGLGAEGVSFGIRVAKLAAKHAPDAVAALVAAYDADRSAGQTFRSWARDTGKDKLQALVADYEGLGTPEDEPDGYVDWDEALPFAVNLGHGECA
ncbi:MAG: nitrite/sulfite reductase [Acidimicrobiia bacterium]